jgi:hypothetical protein
LNAIKKIIILKIQGDNDSGVMAAWKMRAIKQLLS